MDRNSIVGILLIFLIFIGYYFITKPSQQQIDAARRMQDSLARVQQTERVEQQKSIALADSLKKNPIAKAEADSSKKVALDDKYGAFAKMVTDSNQFVTLENKLMKITFTSKGGRPYSVQLKKYTRYDGKPLVLFSGDSTRLGLEFFSQNKLIQTNDLRFTTTSTQKDIMVAQKADSVTYRLYAGNNSYIEYVYTMKPNDYMIKYRVNLVNMGKYIANNSNSIDLDWMMKIPRQEKDSTNESYYSDLQYMFYKADDESMSAHPRKSVEEKVLNNPLKWVAFKQQFFSSILIAGQSFQNGTVKTYRLPDQKKYLKKYSASLGLDFNSQARVSIPLEFYFGPNHFPTLKKYHLGLERIIYLGHNIIRWINQFIIIPIFDWLNGFISNFGLIIFLLTIIIRVGLFPFTFKSYQSQAKMRVLKPEIDELNKKYPKEKALEKQQAVMALYKRAGVNPMGGCLPMLFQFPFLIAMFRFFPTSIELRHQHFLWATDLSSYDSIISWTTNIPIITRFYGNHVSLFTLLMTVTTIISMKMTQQTSAMDNQMPGMKTMMYFMPLMFMFVLNRYSAGLTYYYFLVNLITIGQNELYKRLINEDKLLKQIHANKAKPVKKSKFQQRLDKMSKDRGYNVSRR